MKKLLVSLIWILIISVVIPSLALSQNKQISSISGKVLETMNSGGYSYLKIEENGKSSWFAIPESEVSVGQQISLIRGMDMTDFTSKSLNRTFKSINFSPGLAGAKRPPHGKMHRSKGSVSVPLEKKISVEKAPGSNGYTVAEVYEKKNELDQQKVSVRGKIVKVLSGIMDKNWLHLQDGTGTPGKGSHDLVVTSQELAEVGDIVTAEGTVYSAKDFGSGYSYDVIMEEATIKK